MCRCNPKQCLNTSGYKETYCADCKQVGCVDCTDKLCDVYCTNTLCEYTELHQCNDCKHLFCLTCTTWRRLNDQGRIVSDTLQGKSIRTCFQCALRREWTYRCRFCDEWGKCENPKCKFCNATVCKPEAVCHCGTELLNCCLHLSLLRCTVCERPSCKLCRFHCRTCGSSLGCKTCFRSSIKFAMPECESCRCKAMAVLEQLPLCRDLTRLLYSCLFSQMILPTKG
jgi:hypothetical protein